MIGVTSSGDFRNTRNFIDKILRQDVYSDLNRFGRMGVDALSRATPVDSSLTANSWAYRIIKDRRRPGIEWYNTNAAGTTSVAILIQYGHATGTGGYVPGRDFINPVMQPIFDRITEEVWKKVSHG